MVRAVLAFILILFPAGFAQVRDQQAPELEMKLIAENWLKLVDDENYREAWGELASPVKEKFGEDQLRLMMREERASISKIEARKFIEMRRIRSLPELPEGHYAVMRYEITNMNNTLQTEFIVLRFDENRIWRVFDYFIQSQKEQSLEKELKRLGTESALIIDSQAVDDYPVWSPESRYLAIELAGENGTKWYKVDLSAISLREATWRDGRKIGDLQLYSPAISEADGNEVRRWRLHAKLSPRIIRTGYGTKVNLRLNGFSTALIVTPMGGKPKVVWATGMENCHSLSLSPDERYVAFISEMNGVVVMRIDDIK